MAGFQTKTFEKHDDYMTPKSAWEAIKHLVPKDKVIWEPFYGDGNSGQLLREIGFDVIHQDEDFFENNRGDIVISNPPLFTHHTGTRAPRRARQALRAHYASP